MIVLITKTNRTRVLLLTCMYPRAGFTDIDKLISIRYKVYNRTHNFSWYTVPKTNELSQFKISIGFIGQLIVHLLLPVISTIA